MLISHNVMQRVNRTSTDKNKNRLWKLEKLLYVHENSLIASLHVLYHLLLV